MSSRSQKKSRTIPEPPPLSEPKPLLEWQGDEYVQSLAWSPDGMKIAIAEINGRVSILDGEGKGIHNQIQAHALGCCQIAWHPTQNVLATGGQDGTLKMWDSETGALMHTFGSGVEWVECLAWNPHGTMLAFSQGRKLSVWSGEKGLADDFPRMPSTILGLAWSPSGDAVAAAAYGGVTLYSMDGSLIKREFPWKGSSLSVACSPDGNYIASGQQDNCVHFWRVKSGSDSQMHGYATKVRDIAWSPDSRFLATAGSDEITMWDFQGKGPEGRPPINLKGHRDLVTALAFEETGACLASGSADGGLIFWDAKFRTPLWGIRMSSGLTRVAWARGTSSKLAVATESGTVAVFGVELPQ